VKARVAGPEEVRRATGFAPGGVAPFPLAHVDTVLLDRALLEHETVWIGAGTSRHMAALAPADLVRLTRARPVDGVRENA
jgi:prolyl-tRNA editing enzyme YbaK/EbsC (Cys-tRNA(Pro) deacylase)